MSFAQHGLEIDRATGRIKDKPPAWLQDAMSRRPDLELQFGLSPSNTSAPSAPVTAANSPEPNQNYSNQIPLNSKQNFSQPAPGGIASNSGSRPTPTGPGDPSGDVTFRGVTPTVGDSYSNPFNSLDQEPRLRTQASRQRQSVRLNPDDATDAMTVDGELVSGQKVFQQQTLYQEQNAGSQAPGILKHQLRRSEEKNPKSVEGMCATQTTAECIRTYFL
jgi:hypothetical protein